MTSDPFRRTAREIARRMDYVSMSVGSRRARSHGWWRNLVEFGAWEGPSGSRVGPPGPEAFGGIASLFGTTEEQVRLMIAADWFGVEATDLSPRMLRLAPLVDQLTDNDAQLVEGLIRRLQGQSW